MHYASEPRLMPYPCLLLTAPPPKPRHVMIYPPHDTCAYGSPQRLTHRVVLKLNTHIRVRSSSAHYTHAQRKKTAFPPFPTPAAP